MGLRNGFTQHHKNQQCNRTVQSRCTVAQILAADSARSTPFGVAPFLLHLAHQNRTSVQVGQVVTTPEGLGVLAVPRYNYNKRIMTVWGKPRLTLLFVSDARAGLFTFPLWQSSRSVVARVLRLRLAKITVETRDDAYLGCDDREDEQEDHDCGKVSVRRLCFYFL